MSVDRMKSLMRLVDFIDPDNEFIKYKWKIVEPCGPIQELYTCEFNCSSDENPNNKYVIILYPNVAIMNVSIGRYDHIEFGLAYSNDEAQIIKDLCKHVRTLFEERQKTHENYILSRIDTEIPRR